MKELRPAVFDVPDVMIYFGEVFEHLSKPAIEHERFEISDQTWLIKSEEYCGARLLVKKGQNITIEHTDDLNQDRLALVLLGMAFTAIHFQLGRLPLHGNTLMGKAGAIMLVGDSGAGKSTLSLALTRKGYKLVSDDLSIVDTLGEYDEKFRVFSGCTRLKLWEETCIHYDINMSELNLIDSNRKKFGLELESEELLFSYKLNRIYVLTKSHCTSISFRHITTTAEKLSIFGNLLSKISVSDAQSVWPNVFSNLASVLTRTPVVLVERPISSWSVPKLIEKICNIETC
ncbi:hypothetical protein KUL42_21860 [Alteromonas sp. KUL42]|uniref:hypothetical protein n=1 Tax=Alteromonas sp. KUL42 TaxID=2480797 RepID=UPI0010FFC354|nr:hypothetical protein [Alteromonas sp. KUL42]GEA07425.1 hypothetical protein KUL42_21860 [Alteromonas sp. KUL42]